MAEAPPFPLALPSGVVDLINALDSAGGRAYVVGGAIRDALLRRTLGDIDIEVHSLSADAVRSALAERWSVDAAGAAFAVFKVSGVEGVSGPVDVALPRRDSKVGPGHRGIAVTGDPHIGLEGASRRRDFTINAMAWDPRRGTLIDHHGGRRDLEARVLRAVDVDSFGDDPLRAIRAVQLAARFELEVALETARLCAAMPLVELAAERVTAELEKLLLQSGRPSRGLRLMYDWGMLDHWAPELLPLAETPQEPDWHPEGDVWTHTLLAVDEAAALIGDLDRPRALTVMLATLCHDLGKPATTRFDDGRIRSRGHEEAGVAPTLALLDRWKIHARAGYDVRGQVVALVAHHLKPGQLYADRARVTDGAIRRLARKCEADLLYRVARADCLGRSGDFAPKAMEWFLERARGLDALRSGPEPLLRGRDILALGVAPGPEVGRILAAVFERQLDGLITNVVDALAAAEEIRDDRAPIPPAED